MQTPMLSPKLSLKKTKLDQRVSRQGMIWANLQFFILLVINAFFWSLSHTLQKQWTSSPEQTFELKRWWLGVVSLGTHADPAHLFSNLMGLFVLSFFIFGFLSFSQKHSWILFGSLWTLGFVGHLLTLTTLPHQTGLLGSSGVVFTALGFWLSHYLFLTRQKTLRSRVLRVVGLSLIFLVPESFAPEVSYTSHTYGLILGLMAGVLHFSIFKAQFRSFEVYEEEPPVVKVDESP